MATETYEGTIRLEWDDGPERPEWLEEVVIKDIRESLWGLSKPENLFTHYVQLTPDMNGPSVHVYGVEGSDAFHCLYCLETKWVLASGHDE